MIAAKDYDGVEKILSERGHKVDIVPKIGCSPLHYTRLNVANTENNDGDTPLIAAAKVSYRMVDMILVYGGDPNVTNTERDSPLSIAAVRGDRDSIDALLNAGANLNAAVIKLTSYLRYQKETDLLMSRDSSQDSA
ncbi:ankyrin repeat and SOCS box protein 8-like [Bolinopsis microptera]|uniref:ankyrin repeat and SOCS box protein 8-like n=1 Tax=Bolinopsis microptera TaxID=2820187 RepID=UPI00307A06E5